ncbi:ATP-binding cassette domain-containing protein [Mycoplasmatota bacterium]|nr:ATP-binding cassette domain-containing protein [Mycoplasmatota bacterium]
MEKILEVNDLNVIFETHAGRVHAIRDISFDLYRGETLAIVGESGSGKSVTSKAIMQLLAENGEIISGEILYKKLSGEVIDIAQLKDSQMHHIRGREIAMVFQDPMTSLNPTMTIGKQIMEPLIKHQMFYTPKSIKTEKERTIKELNSNIKRLENDLENTKDEDMIKKLKGLIDKNNKLIKNALEKEKADLEKYQKIEKEKIIQKEALQKEKASLIQEIKGYSKNQEKRKELRKRLSIIKHKLKELTYDEVYKKAIELIRLVGIDRPEKRMKQYPHQFSGGMRQRIVIAIALACNPNILICDEPTTALDVTIQAQIIELIKDLQQKTGCAVIFITHDLGVVANIANRIAVMYAGKICEIGTSRDVFYEPAHPYTWGLLASKPDKDDLKERLYSIPGTPPNLLYPPKGDAFALRSDYAMEIDFEEQPPLFKISDTHYAATWLLHEYAPKVEMPNVIKKRYAKKGVAIRE